jgi:demethylmenaquinone methyltransferase/2-methoxy-6-polyprenyl-1,4-benzoquinol methylase
MEKSWKNYIVETYRKRAENYDFTANLYYLFGYREWAYRRKAVSALKLLPGDTILELACGTGINFPLLQQYVGPTGQIIGVDLTDAMLEQAHKRVAAHGWKNVTLIQQDASTFHIPTQVNAVFSSFALSIFPNTEQTLTNIVNSLPPNGRLVLLDLKIPKSWPAWLSSVAVMSMKPFAITDEWVERRPWRIIRNTIEELLDNVEVAEHYFGLSYVISGQKPSS